MSHALEYIFDPRTVAVIGASDNIYSFGYNYLKHMLNYGFRGKIYPVNPKRDELMGVKAYFDLEQIPDTVEYVISCIGIENVPDLLTKCSRKGVKAIHILAGRASETGRPEAKKLDSEILKRAKEYGIRILGPNAMGVFCPKSGIAFGFDFPKQPGPVGVIAQSGGNAIDLVHFSALRGIGFSKVVSYGNALDINEIDLLEYFAEDQETRTLLCFIEGLKGDPKEFLQLVRKAVSQKPVIICKGGRTAAGARWACSHTASLAGSAKIWESAIRQAGAIPARDIDELVNMAVAFSLLPPVGGKRIGIGGTGGGRSVLTADAWEENGFEVIPLPQDIRAEFKKRGSQVWDWINNPADRSIIIPGDPYNMPAVMSEMAKHPNFDLLAATVAEDRPFEKEAFTDVIKDDAEGYIKTSKECDKPFLVIIADRPLSTHELDNWRYKTYAEIRTRLVNEHVPFFPIVDQAAKAINEQINYYQRKLKAAALRQKEVNSRLT